MAFCDIVFIISLYIGAIIFTAILLAIWTVITFLNFYYR